MAPLPATITIVHCWSAPRSRSTALLYSFEARGSSKGKKGHGRDGGDTVALDEPLYRRWLREKVGDVAVDVNHHDNNGGGSGGSGGGGGGGISRPYAENLLRAAPPPPSGGGSEGDGDGGHDDEAWRWERERMCADERVFRAVESIIANNNGSGISSDKCGDGDFGCVFLKQMAKFSHLFDFATNWETTLRHDALRWDVEAERLASSNGVRIVHRHVLLVRDPVSVLGSWMGKSGDVHGDNPHPDEVGVAQLLDVYSRVLGASMTRKIGENANGSEGQDAVVVIDSDDLAARPGEALRGLCDSLGIGYRDSMLGWEAGPHECDGPWAKWWYHDVWESTGWDAEDGVNNPRTRRYRTVPPSLLPALRMSLPAYDFLRTLAPSHKSRAMTVPPSGKLYEDPRNEHVLVYVGTPGSSDGSRRGGAVGRIVPRDMARISPFDSSVQGGDACWEGIRVYNGRIFHLDMHLDRLFRSARALGFENMHTRSEVVDAIFRVLAANGMRDGAHMRLTLTRGEKCTSSMNPVFNVYGTTLIILPEWKPTEGATTYDNQGGVSLITASNRRSPPGTLDNKVHHNNMIQNILPKIQASRAGAADAIMLDGEGFVAETNATNLFLVRREDGIRGGRYGAAKGGDDEGGAVLDSAVLVTPSGDHCLPGITRGTVLLLARELGISTEVRRVSLSEFYSADEVFTTGTMGELTPVTTIDGRTIGWEDGTRGRGPVTELLQSVYRKAVETRMDWSTEIPAFS